MLEVSSVWFDDLTEAEQEEQPDNGSGKEDSCYIKITHGGDVIAIYSDAIEPEDCSFGRDLRWIKGAIQSAYELGKRDA